MHRQKATRAVDKERYRFHFSQAGRRTLNKCVDYLTYLLVGCVAGLAITEPMGIGTPSFILEIPSRLTMPRVDSIKGT